MISEGIIGLDDDPPVQKSESGESLSEDALEDTPFMTVQGDFGDLEIEDEDDENVNVEEENLFSAEERLSRFGDVLLSACFKDSFNFPM